jgi:DUF971 family protein
MAVYPTEINHIKARGVVRMTWDDGHIGEYDEPYLRGYCPCAMCQGHGAQRRFISVPDAKLQEIRGVGNYAISSAALAGTNLYFRISRSLCPCG